MTHHRRRRRTSLSFQRPRWEGLETRIVLSAIVAVEPAPGAVLAYSPATFHVSFAQPLADYSLGIQDVILDRVNDDGSLAPVFPDGEGPPEALDPDGTGLTFTLAAPLEPGRYRLILSGYSSLSADDGTYLSPLDGSDEPLGDFTVERPGVGLDDAIDLGRAGPTPATVAGSLDFAANPTDVKLYKITLPAGHSWRLGLEVTATRDGGTLDSALTLFDSQGRPLTTNDVGRPDFPKDPFLFAGLQPGTYYVGVSGAGNLPGAPGGYDVVNAAPGLAQAQAGGGFTLHYVADVADLPTALVDFRVVHADPLDPTPTGFTLRFNGPLDLGDSGPSVFAHATGGLTLTDQAGRSWPLAAVNYDEAHAAISYLFFNRLPVGRYTLRLSATNPLADLAGHAVVSPTMPGGVLATFAVAPDTRARPADGPRAVPEADLADARGQAAKAIAPGQTNVVRSEDVGPLTPDLALIGISRSLTLKPGESVVVRFVNLYSDLYTLRINHVGGPLQVHMGLLHGPCYDLDAGPDGQDNSILASLDVGVHLVRFTATGETPVKLTAVLSIGAFSWDSLLANGLAQGPALNLRLTPSTPASFVLGDSPSAANPAASATVSVPNGPAFGPSPDSSAAASAAIAAPGPGGTAHPASAAGLGTIVGSSGLSLDVGGILVGRPSADADHIVAVGPGTASGAVALALAGTGPGQGGAAALSLLRPYASRADAPADSVLSAPRPLTDGSMPPESVPSEVAPRDAAVMPSAVAAVTDEVVPSSDSVTIDPAEIAAIPATAGLPSSPESETHEQAAAISPWIVAIGGIVTLGARRVLRRWNARRKPTFVAARRVPAPHSVSTRVRV